VSKTVIYIGRAMLIAGLVMIVLVPSIGAWINSNAVISVVGFVCLAPVIVKLFPGIENEEVDIISSYNDD